MNLITWKRTLWLVPFSLVLVVLLVGLYRLYLPDVRRLSSPDQSRQVLALRRLLVLNERDVPEWLSDASSMASEAWAVPWNRKPINTDIALCATRLREAGKQFTMLGLSRKDGHYVRDRCLVFDETGALLLDENGLAIPQKPDIFPAVRLNHRGLFQIVVRFVTAASSPDGLMSRIRVFAWESGEFVRILETLNNAYEIGGPVVQPGDDYEESSVLWYAGSSERLGPIVSWDDQADAFAISGADADAPIWIATADSPSSGALAR